MRKERTVVIITDVDKMREILKQTPVPRGTQNGDLYCMRCKEFFHLPQTRTIETMAQVSREFRRKHTH